MFLFRKSQRCYADPWKRGGGFFRLFESDGGDYPELENIAMCRVCGLGCGPAWAGIMLLQIKDDIFPAQRAKSMGMEQS